MNLLEIFDEAKIDIDYGIPKKKKPPFLVYLGNGSSNFKSDNYVYHKHYGYRIEYYFIEKNEEFEDEIETLFDIHEIVWEKSEDIYIENENLFMIYYTV